MDNNQGLANLAFDMPKNQSNVIKVIGVGGGGSNAINHMFQQGIKGVDFVICNTDSQALENSSIPNKIQLGVSLTEGLGAGANPEIGEKAAIESFEEIKAMFATNTKMVFITAGMGGGTGTGAAPIIAKMAREMDILTVGIVTIPFQFEGRMRNEQAQIGVEKLRSQVDSLIVINNNKLRQVYGNLGFKAGFSKADEVLATASRGIAEVITHHYTQNIDLRDAKTVLSNSGTAIMGSANASGANRATEAIVKALDSPLLDDNKITGAKNVLLLIVSGNEEITIDEIGEINDFIQQEAGYGANIIMGVGEDETLNDDISVTIIATGFDKDQQDEIANTESRKIIHSLSEDQIAVQQLSSKNTSSVFIPPVEKITQQPIEKVITPEPVKAKEQEIIVHDLLEDVEEVSISESLLMPTTQNIRNIEVNQPELVDSFSKVEEDDFVIINTQQIMNTIEVKDAEELKVESTKPIDQMALTFDFPVSKSILEIEVKDPIDVVAEPLIEFQAKSEIAPVDVSEGQVIRHMLEEDDVETKIDTKEVAAFEPIIRKEKIEPPIKEEIEPLVKSENPLDQPISEVLRSRASERRARMKDFNYKFRTNAANIDDIEKQPAYKRAGVEIEDVDTNQKISRTTLSTDSSDDLQLRSNNSFLHDNVD